jgi:HAD superfamily hydrolase (TIGR01509 family)
MKTSRDRIRVIALDLMDTVLTDPWMEALEEVTGLPIAETLALRDREAWLAFERGEIDEGAYAARFFPPESGRCLDGAALRRALLARYDFVPGMEDLLGRMAQARPLLALSNYPVWVEALIPRFRLDRFFRGYYISYRLGARKPEAVFFRKVLQADGLVPEEMLLVDDRAENIAGASRLGIPGILFTGAVELARDLAGRGLLPDGAST